MMTDATKPLILLATGGTGGHIFPAVALGQELQKRGFGIALIGGATGMEKNIAAKHGIAFFGVRTGKLDRQNPDVRGPINAALGFWDAFRVVRKIKPACVVGFGGFASFPGCAAAIFAGRPLVLHEANAIGGMVTRNTARFARAIGTAFKNVERLPIKKLHQVGMPVREEQHDARAARIRLGLDASLPLVLVMGGSQGSVAMNRLLPKIILNALVNKNFQVLHQTGQGRENEVLAQLSNQEKTWYKTTEFVDGPLAWSAASLAITRGGSSTIADAAFHGVPLIIVPLPTSADDQQNKNAKAVEAMGAGLLVSQSELEIEHAGGVTPVHAGDMTPVHAGDMTPASHQALAPNGLASGMLRCFEMNQFSKMRNAALAQSPKGAAARLADLVLANLLQESLNKS